MKILIVYDTKHGCTQSAAATLKTLLRDGVTVAHVKEKSELDLETFDVIIVGGSIHAGRVQRRIMNFCEENMAVLEKKRLGLFLCCMYEGEKATAQFEGAFPARLREHAAAVGLFGGVVDFDKMNFVERAIVKKVSGVNETVSNVKEDAIERFAAHISSTTT
jgi:menaquinone-dependent protoporphyrinogen oxidase